MALQSVFRSVSTNNSICYKIFDGKIAVKSAENVKLGLELYRGWGTMPCFIESQIPDPQ
jgi:hypothetical protein